MRRLQIASVSWATGEAAYLVGLFVIAYDLGGPGSVAVIAVIRTLPSVVLAPTMAAMASGRRTDASLRWTLLVRVTSVTALALGLLAGGPLLLLAGLVALDSIAATFLRPLRGAALPAVARSPDELVAGNVALTTGDSLASLVGPALAALVLVAAGPIATFVPGVLGLAIALLASLRLRAATPRAASRPSTAQVPSTRRLEGLRWLAASPARTVVAMFTIQRLVRGAMTVLVVAAAIDLLGMGDPGVGLLTSAMGLGGMAGGVGAVALIGRDRLAPAFVAGIVVWALGIAVIGLLPLAGVALVSLAIGGIGKVLIDVAGYTLLQRTVPNAMRTRVLGIQEGLVTAALAAGSILASGLITVVGVAPALVVAGAIPIVAVVVLWPALRRADSAVVVPTATLALLRGVPMFEPLPIATMEELAAGVERQQAARGEVIVRQGEPGDRFFIIESGTAAVAVDGRADRPLGPGGSFGEIALLRDVPRTATVTASTDVRLVAIERTRFLAAVTGNRSSVAAADRVVETHLGISSSGD